MEKVILFQGDSITDCYRNRDDHAHTGGGYATMVMGELGATQPYQYTFHNRGISGNRIVDLLARTRVDMIQLKPDYMSILIGVNDVWHEFTEGNGVSAQKFEIVYDLLIQELLQELPGLKIMILEPFFLPSEGHEERTEFFAKEVPLRAQAAKRIAEKYGLVFVPLQDMFDKANENAPANYWLRDGVHPTQAGHFLIKEAWLKGFEQLCK